MNTLAHPAAARPATPSIVRATLTELHQRQPTLAIAARSNGAIPATTCLLLAQPTRRPLRGFVKLRQSICYSCPTSAPREVILMPDVPYGTGMEGTDLFLVMRTKCSGQTY